MTVHFRIVGTRLPGRSCAGSREQPGGYHDVHVAIQRGQEPFHPVPGDAKNAVFEFDVPVRDGRFTGPFVHGRGGERFLYLSWGEMTSNGFRMFRRGKVHLDALEPLAVDGRVVECALGLTDERGHPTCASMRPPMITWTVSERR